MLAGVTDSFVTDRLSRAAARDGATGPCPIPFVPARSHIQAGWTVEVRVGFVLLLVVGAAAGFLATRMMKLNTDVPTTIAIGVGGALIGGVVIRILLEVTGWLAGFMGAVLGALLLIWLWKTYVTRR
jgi:uncharacterized membrane protein YeaQ/YmgE (transglycosylase-associated protein family)